MCWDGLHTMVSTSNKTSCNHYNLFVLFFFGGGGTEVVGNIDSLIISECGIASKYYSKNLHFILLLLDFLDDRLKDPCQSTRTFTFSGLANTWYLQITGSELHFNHCYLSVFAQSQSQLPVQQAKISYILHSKRGRGSSQEQVNNMEFTL